MPYQCVATSVAGFVQQLACNYLPHGYWFYVTGHMPEKKDPRAVDEKLLGKYDIALSRQSRARRKLAGYANLHYLRHGRAFPAKQKPVLVLKSLQPTRRYVVLALRRRLVRFRFSGRPFSHLVVLPAQIRWAPPRPQDKVIRCRTGSA